MLLVLLLPKLLLILLHFLLPLLFFNLFLIFLKVIYPRRLCLFLFPLFQLFNVGNVFGIVSNALRYRFQVQLPIILPFLNPFLHGLQLLLCELVLVGEGVGEAAREELVVRGSTKGCLRCWLEEAAGVGRQPWEVAELTFSCDRSHRLDDFSRSSTLAASEYGLDLVNV